MSKDYKIKDIIRDNSIPVFYFIVFFLFIYLSQAPILHFQESQTFFSFDAYHLSQYFSKPGFLGVRASDFISQFYHSPFVGALMIAVMLSLTHLLFATLTGFGKTHLYSVLPSVMLLLMHTYLFFPVGITVMALIFVLFLVVNGKIKGSLYRHAFIVLSVAILLFYSPFVAWLFLLALGIQGHRNGKKPNMLLVSIAGLAILVFIFLAYYIFYNTYPLPDIIFGVLHFVRPINGIFVNIALSFLFILLLILPLLKNQSGALKSFNSVWLTGSVGLLIILALNLANLTPAFFREVLSMEEAYAKTDYDRVLRIAKKSKSGMQFVPYYANLALDAKGELNERLFEFNDVWRGEGLFIPFKRDRLYTYFGRKVFSVLNLPNLAYRWDYETMMINGKSALLLKSLAFSSILTKEYNLAQRYLNMLKSTVFYKKWALEMEVLIHDPSKIAMDERIIQKRRLLLNNTDVYFSDKIDERLLFKYIVETEPDNQQALDYYIAGLLLDKNLEELYQLLRVLKRNKLKELPALVQEAMLIHQARAGKNYFFGYVFDEKIQTAFKDFTLLSRQGSKGRAAIEKKYKYTCWYYYMYR